MHVSYFYFYSLVLYPFAKKKGRRRKRRNEKGKMQNVPFSLPLSVELIDYSFSIHLSVCFLATGAPMNLRPEMFYYFIYLYIFLQKMLPACVRVDLLIIIKGACLDCCRAALGADQGKSHWSANICHNLQRRSYRINRVSLFFQHLFSRCHSTEEHHDLKCKMV